MFFLSQTRPVRPRTYAGVGPESYGIRLDPNQSLWFGSGPVGRRSRSVWAIPNHHGFTRTWSLNSYLGNGEKRYKYLVFEGSCAIFLRYWVSRVQGLDTNQIVPTCQRDPLLGRTCPASFNRAAEPSGERQDCGEVGETARVQSPKDEGIARNTIV